MTVNLERLHELSDAELEAAYAAAIERAHDAPRSVEGAHSDARARSSQDAFYIVDEIKRRARGDRA